MPDIVTLVFLLIPMVIIGGLFALAATFLVLAIRQAQKEGRSIH